MTVLMKPKSSKDFAPFIEKLLATVLAGTTKGKTKHAQRAFMTPRGMLALDGKAANALDTITRELGATELGEMFSQSYLGERMVLVVKRLARVSRKNIGQAISAQVAKTLKSLSKARLHVYYVTAPISGVRVSPRSFAPKVGKCWVYCLANHRHSRWLAKTAVNPLSRLMKMTPPGGSEYWIKTKVHALPTDNSKIEDDAFRQIRISSAALMLFSPLEKRNAALFLPRLPLLEVSASKSSVYNAYIVEIRKPSWAGEHVASSALPTLLLDKTTMRAFGKFAFRRVSKTIANPKSELDEIILDSFRVLYSSFSSPDLVWRYIGFVTCLEKLLTITDERSIMRNLAERLAWILGEKQKPEYRLGVRDKMIEIYRRRSAIVHKATSFETLSQDLLQLHAFLLSLVCLLSDGRFKNISEIKNWTERKMLGF